jgi:signal transduction histidine kinase
MGAGERETKKRSWLDRLRRPPTLTEALQAPALICQESGRIVEANAAGRAMLLTHGLRPEALAEEGWPTHDGRDVTEILMPQAGLQLSRHRLANGDWLVLPRPADDPALTSRLFRSAHELLARVIATVAHDLRSPLASLFFNVGVLRKRWAQLPAEQVDATLDAMGRACELEMKTVAALVERIDADGRERLTLGALFDRIAELMNPVFRGDSNQLLVQVNREVAVVGASILLDQIFVNLIGNAVDSRADPVTVRISSSFSPGDRQVRVRVANDGPPIDPALREMIFRPFFTTKPTGTGMGLSFAREAARQLGGDLELLAGEPTVFEVRLPVRTGGVS